MLTLLVFTLAGSLAAAAPGETKRVSVSSSGEQGNYHSYDHSVSADGRYVAFGSQASNLVAGDTNDCWDAFVHDRQTGLTERVSVDSSGVQGNNHSSYPSVSADGRYVAFWSRASNLVAGDTNDDWDVFVRDRRTGLTELVSVGSNGQQGNGYSADPSVSADGRYVAFVSLASNLVAGDTNDNWDVFVRDRRTGLTELVSVSSTGEQGNNEGSWEFSMSADGRYVAFVSLASNLVAGDTNDEWDVFLHDRQTRLTERVSVSSAGEQGNDVSYAPSVSADGRYVAFRSNASDLVSGDTNKDPDVFVHDRQTGITERVSVSSSGEQGEGDISYNSSVSADGRYVAFESDASNLVAGDTNGLRDVFVRDRQTGLTERVSVGSNGEQGNGGSGIPDARSSLSADGRYVAFDSEASNLVAGDTNSRPDVFVHERLVGVSPGDLGVIVLPDLNGNSVGEVGLLRGAAVLEIRDGGSGALLQNLPALSAGFSAMAVQPLPDADGNGVAELAVLAMRQSDGRAVVEIRNLSGAPAMRQIWFAANHTPLALAVVHDDADNNGVVELAVLSRRDSDGRGLVEVKNAYGATNPRAIWAGAGLTPLELAVVPDADSNGVPEVAVLSRRDSDGRTVVEIRNAAGATNPNAVWFMPDTTALALAVVADKDLDGIPEVAVLSRRDSDGRNLVEVKNAAGATRPATVWFAAGHTGLALAALGDADGNAVPEVAVLSRRDSDGRILVEVKNAAAATNPRFLWYPTGFTALDLAILPDADGNGVAEAAVLMSRDSDGRMLVQSRNAAGDQVPKNYWFAP